MRGGCGYLEVNCGAARVATTRKKDTSIQDASAEVCVATVCWYLRGALGGVRVVSRTGLHVDWTCGGWVVVRKSLVYLELALVMGIGSWINSDILTVPVSSKTRAKGVLRASSAPRRRARAIHLSAVVQLSQIPCEKGKQVQDQSMRRKAAM